jgi:hypothetical protein
MLPETSPFRARRRRSPQLAKERLSICASLFDISVGVAGKRSRRKIETASAVHRAADLHTRTPPKYGNTNFSGADWSKVARTG